jgi:hypothetical protein
MNDLMLELGVLLAIVWTAEAGSRLQAGGAPHR